jgi:Ribbon-helix-helix protein, copG family
MISFRLSAEEYDRFRELCSSLGSRSVSELARAAIHSLLNQTPPATGEGLECRVTELEGRVHMLGLEFRKLRQRETNGTLEQPATTQVQRPTPTG